MKNILLSMLLALTTSISHAKGTNFENPQFIFEMNNNAEYCINKVSFTHSATILDITFTANEKTTICIPSDCYITDLADKHYPLVSVEGLMLNKTTIVNKGESRHFSIQFKPMTSTTKMFHYYEGTSSNSQKIIGIHDKSLEHGSLPLEDYIKAHPYTMPNSWFKTGTITVRGKIEDYDADKLGFRTLEYIHSDIFKFKLDKIVCNIQSDGTFEAKFEADHPVLGSFNAKEDCNLPTLYFYALPGETIDFAVRKDDNDQYKCLYLNGSSKETERFLQNKFYYSSIAYMLLGINKPIHAAKQDIEDNWNKMTFYISNLCEFMHYTPLEAQLAYTDAQTIFATFLFYYAEQSENNYRQHNEHAAKGNKIENTEIIAPYIDAKNYSIMSKIDCNNPMVLSTLHGVDFAQYLYFCRPLSLPGFITSLQDPAQLVTMKTIERERKWIDHTHNVINEMTDGKQNDFMSQLILYIRFIQQNEAWLSQKANKKQTQNDSFLSVKQNQPEKSTHSELSEIYDIYHSAITHPYIRKRLEQLYTELTSK